MIVGVTAEQMGRFRLLEDALRHHAMGGVLTRAELNRKWLDGVSAILGAEVVRLGRSGGQSFARIRLVGPDGELEGEPWRLAWVYVGEERR